MWWIWYFIHITKKHATNLITSEFASKPIYIAYKKGADLVLEAPTHGKDILRQIFPSKREEAASKALTWVGSKKGINWNKPSPANANRLLWTHDLVTQWDRYHHCTRPALLSI
jgi:hypothetical protein